MNFEPRKSLWAADAPAPDERSGEPSPPAVPKKKPEPEKLPEEEPLRRAG
jgi:hypothetical protein